MLPNPVRGAWIEIRIFSAYWSTRSTAAPHEERETSRFPEVKKEACGKSNQQKGGNGVGSVSLKSQYVI